MGGGGAARTWAGARGVHHKRGGRRGAGEFGRGGAGDGLSTIGSVDSDLGAREMAESSRSGRTSTTIDHR